MLVNLIFLGLRFFFVPRNLRGLVITASRISARAGVRHAGSLSNSAVAGHFFIVLCHGALFFLVCREFEFVVFSMSSNLTLSSSLFTGYILLHALLLLLNAAWIAYIQRRERRMERMLSPDQQQDARAAPGKVWWRNNLTCSLVALAPFSLAGTCTSSTAQCVRQGSDGTAVLFPTSPHVFATVYYDLASGLDALGAGSLYLPVYWVFLVFLINSLYDLLNAGRFYLLVEEVEWEQTVAPADVKAESAASRPV
jgi:hypothetical protein